MSPARCQGWLATPDGVHVRAHACRMCCASTARASWAARRPRWAAAARASRTTLTRTASCASAAATRPPWSTPRRACAYACMHAFTPAGSRAHAVSGPPAHLRLRKLCQPPDPAGGPLGAHACIAVTPALQPSARCVRLASPPETTQLCAIWEACTQYMRLEVHTSVAVLAVARYTCTRLSELFILTLVLQN